MRQAKNKKAGRSRAPITASQAFFRMKRPSLKAGRMVHCESPLEGDFVLRCDFDELISAVQEQPERLDYKRDGKSRRYTPDFRITRNHLSPLVEIKPEEKLGEEDVRDKLQFVQSLYAERGENLVLVTDREIRQEPFLSNLKLLKRYRRRSLMGMLGAQLASQIKHVLPASADELSPLLGGHATVLALIAAGHLSCDLSLPFDQALTSITTKDQGDQK
ncbi:MAG: TnsA endonuclease N-terminal domain-containing protein [Thiobacillus sp.]